MKTRWHCEACDATGEVNHCEGAGLWQLFEQIHGDHDSVSPDCEFDRRQVRVELVAEDGD